MEDRFDLPTHTMTYDVKIGLDFIRFPFDRSLSPSLALKQCVTSHDASICGPSFITESISTETLISNATKAMNLGFEQYEYL